MPKLQSDHLEAINLSEQVWVKASVPIENHAALRCGFIGYPANPRWNQSKFRAWKTGRSWREAFKKGELVVGQNSQLIPVSR